MNNYLSGILCSLLFILILLIIEALTRQYDLNKELARKLVHFLSGIFGIVMGLSFEKSIFIFLVLLFLVMITFSYLFSFFRSIHGVKRKTYGEILFPFGILVAYLITDGPNNNYIASLLILSVSDPLSGIAGSMIRNKSYLGSVSFFISCFLILYIITPDNSLSYMILLTFILMLIEKISPWGTDNLTIAFAASLLLKIS